MQPQNSSPSIGPENTPSQPSGGEFSSGVKSEQIDQSHSPEQPVSNETRESFSDGMGDGDPNSAVQQALVVPPPMPVVGDDQMLASSVPNDGSPAVAGDEDLIEKEWVDKAKKVINETRDDPYNQEKAFGQLQADYIHKRYGKTINAASKDG